MGIYGILWSGRTAEQCSRCPLMREKVLSDREYGDRMDSPVPGTGGVYRKYHGKGT